MTTLFNFTTSNKSPPSYNNFNNNNIEESPFRYNQGNKITSILFLSLISIFIIIISITLLNFLKSVFLYNEFNEFKYKVKKYFLKYIEKIFFCFGILVMVWYFAESLNLVNIIESLFSESLLVNKINLINNSNNNNNNGDNSNNINHEEIIIATTTTKSTKISKIENEYISIEPKLNKNRFLNLAVQIIITFFIYYFQTLYYWVFQLIILKKSSSSPSFPSSPISSSSSSPNNKNNKNNSNHHNNHNNSNNKVSTFNITPIKFILNSYNKTFNNINLKNNSLQQLSSQNYNNNNNNNNNQQQQQQQQQQKLIFKFQNDYVEPIVERMLDLPWITILVALLLSWLSIRLYLENVPIHSLNGKWSLENILVVITYITFGCFISSLIIFLYSVLFLNYNNKILKNSIMVNNNSNNNNNSSSSSSDNSNKKINKKRKQIINNKNKSSSPVLNNSSGDSESDNEKEANINSNYNNDNDSMEEDTISFDFGGLIYILKIITLFCAIIGIVLANIGLNNINNQQLSSRTTIFSTSELSNTNDNYDSSFVPTVIIKLDDNQNIITNIPKNIQDQQPPQQQQLQQSQSVSGPTQVELEQHPSPPSPADHQKIEQQEEKPVAASLDQQQKEQEQQSTTSVQNELQELKPSQVLENNYPIKEELNDDQEKLNEKVEEIINNDNTNNDDNEMIFSKEEQEILEIKKKAFDRILEMDQGEFDLVDSKFKNELIETHQDNMKKVEQHQKKAQEIIVGEQQDEIINIKTNLHSNQNNDNEDGSNKKDNINNINNNNNNNNNDEITNKDNNNKNINNLEELKSQIEDSNNNNNKIETIIENIPRSLNANNHEILQNNNTNNSTSSNSKINNCNHNNNNNHDELNIFNFIASVTNRIIKYYYSCFNNNYNNGNIVLLNIILLSIIIFILNPMSLTILPLLAYLCNINNMCGDYNYDLESSNNSSINNNLKKKDIINLVSPIKND